MIIYDIRQGTAEWHKLRCGIPTASEFDRLLTPKTQKPSTSATGYLYQKLAEWALGTPLDSSTSDYMHRGSALEDEARRWYCFDRDAKPEQIGFVTNDEGTAGASPDALVETEGVLEIKCLSAANHIAALLGDADEYVLQIQGQLWLTERRWCDRMYYHPSLPPHVVRLERDDELIESISRAVADFNVRLADGKARLLDCGVAPATVRNLPAPLSGQEEPKPSDDLLAGFFS